MKHVCFIAITLLQCRVPGEMLEYFACRPRVQTASLGFGKCFKNMHEKTFVMPIFLHKYLYSYSCLTHCQMDESIFKSGDSRAV